MAPISLSLWLVVNDLSILGSFGHLSFEKLAICFSKTLINHLHISFGRYGKFCFYSESFYEILVQLQVVKEVYKPSLYSSTKCVLKGQCDE